MRGPDKEFQIFAGTVEIMNSDNQKNQAGTDFLLSRTYERKPNWLQLQCRSEVTFKKAEIKSK